MSAIRYTPPVEGAGQPRYLVPVADGPHQQRFIFYESLEIGRDEANRPASPGLLLVDDAVISFRHCIITQRPDGRCYVRDLSRNGTRLEGRRLIPNVEVELQPAQTLEIAPNRRFMLTGEPSRRAVGPAAEGRTVAAPGFTVATVLVGDIRDYTVLVRRAPATDLQQSVGRVLEILAAEVVRHGGAVKEYQGDAIFAFWENALDRRQTIAACRAAIALDRLTAQMAADPAIWSVADFPLKMDWALATGPVVIDSHGGAQRAGLSMIGEAVVLAFRLEKFASDETGPIVTCPTTRDIAGTAFTFRDLGERQANGFDRPGRVFALSVSRPTGGTTGVGEVSS